MVYQVIVISASQIFKYSPDLSISYTLLVPVVYYFIGSIAVSTFQNLIDHITLVKKRTQKY